MNNKAKVNTGARTLNANDDDDDGGDDTDDGNDDDDNYHSYDDLEDD